MGLNANDEPAEQPQHEQNKKPKRNMRLIGAVIVIAIIAIGGGVYALSGSNSSLPQSTNVYPSVTSTCKSFTTAFTCTVTLEAHSGSVTPSEVKAVYVNGTQETPTMTSSGSATTVVVNVPIATPACVSGCPPSAAINSIPHVGEVVIDLTGGTEVSVQLGSGGIIK